MTTPEPEQPSPAPPPYAGPPAYAAPPTYGPPPAYGPPPPEGVLAAARAARRPVKTVDVIVTIVLLVGDAVLAVLASFMGMFLVMASDPCGVRQCSTELITIGWLMGMALPWVALIVTVVVAVILMVKRRLAFWVALAGAVLIVLSLVLAFAVTSAGVPGSGV